MRVLTDTHSLVWGLSDPSSLSKDALLTDPLAWRDKYLARSGIPALTIRAAHVIALGALPEIHKDLFDRILVAQSMVEKLPLVSKDASLD